MTEPGRNGHSTDRDISSILEDWLFLVEEDAGVLASCCEYGLNVSTWDEMALGHGVKDKKVILVFKDIREERAEEFAVLGRVREAGAALVKIWKPTFLGDDKTPTLRALAARYSLADMLYFEKPWTYDPAPPRPAERRAGWPCTDLGNAERMASRYGPVIRYCRPWGKWLVWTGQRWEQDDLGKVNVMAKATVRKILDEAAAAFDQAERIILAKWAIACESAGRVGALLKLVWSEPHIPLLPSALDPDPWLFNCPNGTIELKTGNLKRHERGDMITRMSPVEFDPGARCDLWEETIDRIFAGNQDLIGFIQRLFGMCLTGNCSEQVLPIFYGEGGNGKSTTLNALIDIMGPDYAIMAPPGLLFSKQGSSHPTDRASLFGMRLVVDMESADGAHLNEALVKQLTGSDRISARRMNEDFWTFVPTHKLIIGTNNQPAIQETKNAIWRRLKLVPFTVEIPEAEQQADLPTRLRLEFPGILAWCVRGCVEWVQNGLQTPELVQNATAEYRAEEDALGTFLAEECITGPSIRVKASTLYQRYRTGMDGSGTVPITQTAFGRSMKKRGFEKLVSNGKWYLGITLRSDGKDDTSLLY